MHHFSGYWKVFFYWARVFLAGIITGLGFVYIHALLQPPTTLPFLLFNAPSSTLPAEFKPQATSKRSVTCYQYQEALIERLPVATVPPVPKLAIKISPKQLPFYAKYVPVPKDVSPNSIRLHRSQVPPLAGKVKIVNGRPTCAKKNDKPKKSTQNKRAHIDRECCLDPDEVPHPACKY